MTELMLILAAPFIAIAVGYWFGKDQLDPNTPEGRAYYARRD